MILCFSINWLNAQCTCMGGASVGGFTPVGGTSNIGLLKAGHLRLINYYVYSNGNKYYKGSEETESGVVKSYNSTFTGLMVGYGLFDDFTVDMDLGYYIDKRQDFEAYNLSGSGFSHFSIYGKYNVLSSTFNEIEWTLGLGARIPLVLTEQNLPQNIKSSTGAFGGILLSYLHKGFKSNTLHFILVNRIEINAENSTTYLYGPGFTNSLFITKGIIEKLTGMLEIRNDIKLMDYKYDKLIDDSGWNTLILSPQLNYSVNNFNFSIYYDFPFYKHYNGTQLTNKSNFGISLTWQNNLGRIF